MATQTERLELRLPLPLAESREWLDCAHTYGDCARCLALQVGSRAPGPDLAPSYYHLTSTWDGHLLPYAQVDPGWVPEGRPPLPLPPGLEEELRAA